MNRLKKSVIEIALLFGGAIALGYFYRSFSPSLTALVIFTVVSGLWGAAVHQIGKRL
jgi:hypothetical protein